MNAFIVRPFGQKEDIDFDKVEELLIRPALQAAGVTGSTTAVILAAGNIRHDMFQLLLTADLVIADLSIHNANVFYELGIRHALRDKRTILIRCSGDEIPFDLKTDRYFSYDRDTPAATLDMLTKAIQATLASEDRDSPVFQLIPELEAQESSHFLVVPRDFREGVERALRKMRPDDLTNLAGQAAGLTWEQEGLRLVGRAQFKLKDLPGAQDTWEWIRKVDAEDCEANLSLGTIYQKLKDLTNADLAIQRVINLKKLSPGQRAESYSLMGSNAKTRWQEEWGAVTVDRQATAALHSAHLKGAYELYEQGFLEDLDHFYSGINAVALLTIMTELATEFPDTWSAGFDSDDEATEELQHLKSRLDQLGKAVALSVEATGRRLERKGEHDRWYDITVADLKCLTIPKPARVAKAYRDALTDAEPFYFDPACRQLQLLDQLGVMQENARAALAEIEMIRPK